MRKWFIAAILLVAFITIFWWRQSRREHRYDGAIRSAARRYQVDPALIKAVIWTESRFDAEARGKAGEIGLMQILSPAASEWAKAEHKFFFTPENLLDPEENTLAGTWYLRKLWQRYLKTDNPMPYALADYNAGRNNVLKWNRGPAATNSAAFIRNIGFPSTKKYVHSVMGRYEHYRGTFPPRERAATP